IQTRLSAELPEQTDKSAPIVAGPEQPAPQVGFAQGGTKDEVDPVLKGVGARLGKMIAAGASDANVIEFLRKNGVDPTNTNVQQALQFRKTKEYKAWQRANP